MVANHWKLRRKAEEVCAYDGYGRAVCGDELLDDVEPREVRLTYECFELFEKIAEGVCRRYGVGNCSDTVSNLWCTCFARP